uniref:Secreted protein n=1 Tax=Picea glauca TaxID=3330 RepID=A0A101LY27_PICGL|nr:hypothetical protein ABT39_MTgene5643 [Picea glauca]
MALLLYTQLALFGRSVGLENAYISHRCFLLCCLYPRPMGKLQWIMGQPAQVHWLSQLDKKEKLTPPLCHLHV